MKHFRWQTRLCITTLWALTACAPSERSAPQTPEQTAVSQAVQNGFSDAFEKQYFEQCLVEQTSVNVDTKIFCVCMASFVVRDNQATDIMPLWDAHLAGTQTAEQKTSWNALADKAKKQRGCKIEKF